VGDSGDRALIKGGETTGPAGYLSDRFLMIREGADGVVFSNYTVGNLQHGSNDGANGDVVLYGHGSSTPITNTTIHKVHFVNPTPTPAKSKKCDVEDQTGCVSGGVIGRNARIVGLDISTCVFENFRYRGTVLYPVGMSLVGDTLSDLHVHDSEFLRIQVDDGAYSATIDLPTDHRMTGVNIIERNHFDSVGTIDPQKRAIYWNSSAGDNDYSNLVIQDNHFDGVTEETISLYQVGMTTVRRNTFGTSTMSQATTSDEESKHDNVMLRNGLHTSHQIRTWKPTSATPVDCRVDVVVDKNINSSENSPTTPVEIDVYWTKLRTAERYLGTATATAAGTISVPYKTGEAGYIRIQTHGQTTTPGVLESSQYSRTVAVGKPRCASAVDIDMRAWNHVSGGSPTYESIIGDAHAHEIEAESAHAVGTVVWWTFTVTNEGDTTLHDLRVTDTGNPGSTEREVCKIQELPPGGRAGCVASSTMTPTNREDP
jgi:hypothetical protein